MAVLTGGFAELIRFRAMDALNRPAVIVADMLVDFVTGALANPPSQECVAPIARLLDTARERGWPVCYANDAHLPGDMEEHIWGRHALAGTPGAQVVPELAPQEGDFQFPKRWYSGFHETGLGMYLKQCGVKTVILTGQHAHICVQHTAGDAFIEGFRVVLAEDGISAFTLEDKAAGLAYMQKMYGATVATVDEIVGAPVAAAV